MFRELVLLNYFHGLAPSCVKNAKIRLNDGTLISLFSTDLYLDLLIAHGWEVGLGCVAKNGIRFVKGSDYSAIYEVFERKIYATELRGKTVVDIGAGTGDSSLFFAFSGASEVLAYEPSPLRFELMRMNLALNPELGRRIQASKTMVVPCKVAGDNESVSLGSILNRISGPSLLKIDCEGCEFPLVLEDYEHVRRFDELIFEFHPNITHLRVSVLAKALTKDFHFSVVAGDDVLGVAHCFKNSQNNYRRT